MKSIRAIGIACTLAAFCPAFVFAQPKDAKEQKEKSPADAAYDAFMALRNDKEAKPNPARFQKLSKAGVAFVAEHPKHRQAGNVIAKLYDFAGTMPGGEKGMRKAWFAQVQLEAVNKQFDDSVTEDGKAGLLAIDAAAAEGEARENAVLAQEAGKTKGPDASAKSRQMGESITQWRGKIDALAAAPGGGRFLKDRENGFVEFLKHLNPRAAEAHLVKLTKSGEKSVAAWAGEEINFMEVRKQPYELTFTALDGSAVDFAKLRGKIVYLLFWSTTAKGFAEELEALQSGYAYHSRKNFEIVTVCYDKEADREKVAAFVKEKKIKWPVYFDGQGDANEFGKKLNAKNLPAGYLFDRQGFLVKTFTRMKSVEGDVEKLLTLK